MTPAPSTGTALNGERRSVELADLADGKPVDVLVIGGGTAGTMAALTTAENGAQVLLLENVR